MQHAHQAATHNGREAPPPGRGQLLITPCPAVPAHAPADRTLSVGTTTTRSNQGGGPPSALSSAYSVVDASRCLTGKTGSFGYMVRRC